MLIYVFFVYLNGKYHFDSDNVIISVPYVIF